MMMQRKKTLSQKHKMIFPARGYIPRLVKTVRFENSFSFEWNKFYAREKYGI